MRAERAGRAEGAEQDRMAKQFLEFLETPEARRILSAAMHQAFDRLERQPGTQPGKDS